MSRFLIVYRGAPGEQDAEGAEHRPARWRTWLDNLGAAVVDRGDLTQASIEIPSRLIGPKLSASALSGYSIIQAGDFDAAVRMVEQCPIFDEKGSVEVARLD